MMPNMLMAQDPANIPLFLRLSAMREAETPSIVRDEILFTYQAQQPLRSVAVAFEHENYQILHPMRRNEHAVFFLFYPLERTNNRLLRYRYIVDGIWRHDPRNPRFDMQPNGVRISAVALPDRSHTKTYPIVGDDGKVDFVFRPLQRLQSDLYSVHGERLYFESPDDLRVFVAGSFNGWDPFLQPLVQSVAEPTEYRLSTRLSSGTHYYYFVVNGYKVIDPNNPNIGSDRNARRASIVSMPPQS